MINLGRWSNILIRMSEEEKARTVVDVLLYHTTLKNNKLLRDRLVVAADIIIRNCLIMK